VQPRSFDIWAVDHVAELVKEAREINPELRAVTVLNAADAQGRDNDEADEALHEIAGLEVLPLTIGRRKAFPNAAARGRAVTEAIPRDVKAVGELHALLKALYL
jgi:chromosome partitioning protein